MLVEQIAKAQKLVRTDAYQMSIGELVSMYEDRELTIDPEFQRLFRWEIGQKSKFIESLLLGIPIPSIFVFEKNNGKWELVDGLQRISTILEFMGKLRSTDGETSPPSVLESTRYLPDLHNVVWDKSELIKGVKEREQRPLEKPLQLSIRRARIGVEILKRPSDEATKFELFQRLNAGGTQANPQELRNCIMLMINPDYFRSVRADAENKTFKAIIGVTPDQLEKQRHVELAVRFLVHNFIDYDGSLDVEEYIDDGIVKLARQGDKNNAHETTARTFALLHSACGKDALRRFDGRRHLGKVGLVALEAIAVGVAKNLRRISRLNDKVGFVRNKIQDFWNQEDVARMTSPGLRGTTRIQRTVPFGEVWFRP